jgi:hypothetical protein
MNMRLLINRSHGHLRFMDFRVGNYDQKCTALDHLAHEQGLNKVFTLVEKQDSNNWKSAGFHREGVYPAYFRTADAYVMSRLYDSQGEPTPIEPPGKNQTERRVNQKGRKVNKPDKVRWELIEDERSVTELLDDFNGQLRSLPFGRAAGPDLVLHAKARATEGWVCAEIEDSFGHAVVAFAPPPTNEKQLGLATYAGSVLVDQLRNKQVNNMFGLSPVSDVWANELFCELGFRVTGRLSHHIRTPKGEYSNALIWHRRLNAGRQ